MEKSKIDLGDFSADLLTGGRANLGDFSGQVLLIVNTASQCGFTPQYAGLEALYQTYKGQGFAVLGFPCNQFGGQEPGNAAEIGAFCQSHYGVTFPMFAKVDVNGPGEHPLFTFLKAERPGFLGMRRIGWNFTKFLLDRKGRVSARFAPRVTPQKLTVPIERLLEGV